MDLFGLYRYCYENNNQSNTKYADSLDLIGSFSILRFKFTHSSFIGLFSCDLSKSSLIRINHDDHHSLEQTQINSSHEIRQIQSNSASFSPILSKNWRFLIIIIIIVQNHHHHHHIQVNGREMPLHGDMVHLHIVANIRETTSDTTHHYY